MDYRDDAAAKIKAARKEAASLGKFYTPESLSRLTARLAINDRKVETIYDPTCGSGELLKIASEYASGATLYGQDVDVESCERAKQNLGDCNVVSGDTLTNPFDFGRFFDAIVSNPPFGVSWTPKEDARFVGGLAPRSSSEWAFIQHSFHFLSDDGRAAFILPQSVLGRKGGETIRRYFIEFGAIETVIQTPSGLFQATGISTVILVFTKKINDGVYFLNASKEYSGGGRNKRYISDEQINEILTKVKNKQESDVSRIVAFNEIQKNGFSLEFGCYFKSKYDPGPNIEELLDQLVADSEEKLKLAIQLRADLLNTLNRSVEI